MITVYSTPTCGYCKKIKEDLKAKGLAFSEIDIYSSEKGFDELMLKTKGRMLVPVVDFNGKIYIGYTAELKKEIGV